MKRAMGRGGLKSRERNVACPLLMDCFCLPGTLMKKEEVQGLRCFAS